MIPIDENIFQMGWFNHQLVNLLGVLIYEFSLRWNLGDGNNQVPYGMSFERDFPGVQSS